MNETNGQNFKVPFQFKGRHHCEAVAIACIDFRFWKETARFIEEKLRIKSYDFPKLPGAAKALNESTEGDLASSCVKVPVDLHQVSKIVIINHSDCGAYGGRAKFNDDVEAEQEFHFNELKKARKILADKYPNQEIITVYAELDKEQGAIEFIIV